MKNQHDDKTKVRKNSYMKTQTPRYCCKVPVYWGMFCDELIVAWVVGGEVF